MKKLICLLLALCAVISLQGCFGDSGDKAPPPSSEDQNGNGGDTGEPPTEEPPLPEPPPEPTGRTFFSRHAFLEGRQVVPSATSTNATGKASAALENALGEFTAKAEISATTSPVTSVTIHDGDIGSNGKAVVSLTENPPGSGIWTILEPAAAFAALTPLEIERFKSAGFHILVKTGDNPEGEIRGQLISFLDDIQPLFDSFFCIFCHNPAGRGAFTGLILNPAVSYDRLVNQPAATINDIRVLPFDADNSALYKMISGSGLSAIGRRMPVSGPYLPLKEENLIKTWINMGAMNDDGVAPAPVPLPPVQFTRSAVLSSSQLVSVAPVVTSATGTARMVLDSGTRLLSGSVTLLNVNSPVTAVEVRDGDIGSIGAVVAILVSEGGGVWTIPSSSSPLAPAVVNRFRAAGFYVEVRTVANPEGELRGQLMSYADNVQPQFDGYCTICHTPTGTVQVGLDLRSGFSYGSIVNQPATLTPGIRVIPFDSANSVFFRRITGAGFTEIGQRMPADGPPFLPPHDEKIIKTWIDMGAPND